MYLLCVGSGLFSKFGAYRNAVGVARKHFVNWPELVVSAFLGRGGVYRSRGGGVISCDAKTLLRRFVRMEYVWRLHGDTLPTVRFEDDSMVIPNYFGRDFRVPLNMELVSPPSIYLKAHPYDVAGEVVLDIGAYLGDTPLMWLYKGARSVIAVEPVPLHYKYLERNVAGLPVVCINASLAVQLPYDPTKEGLISYGLWDDVDDSLEMLDVPVVQLTELVEKYRPTVVKLNCEGCEHYALDHLSQLPQLGVKKISVQFHGIKGHDPYESLSFLEKKLGMSVKVGEGEIRSLSGRKVKSLFAYWLF
jgi:FkbM family methyltransferase